MQLPRRLRLFTPKSALQFTSRAPVGGVTNGYGHQLFTIPSPQYGAEIVYRVGRAPSAQPTVPNQPAGGGTTATPAPAGGGQTVFAPGQGRAGGASQARITIFNAANDTLATLTGPANVGVHRVTWGLFPRFTPVPLTPSQKRDSALRIARIGVVFDTRCNAPVSAPIQCSIRSGGCS